MSNSPLVSVMALCYNHSSFVIQALDSVLNQTYKNIELFIIDDNSSDGSQEVIEKWIQFNNAKCTFIKHNKNRTICYSYNEFLRLAKGKYISSIATDDVFYPEKTERQVAIFETLPPAYGVLYSDLNVINQDNQVLDDSFYHWFMGNDRPKPDQIIDSLVKYGHNTVQVTGTLVKKEVYEKVGPYDESLVGEDFDMSFRWARATRFYYTPDVVASYRKSPNQFNSVFSQDREKRLKVNMLVHQVFVKNLDLGSKYHEKIIEKLRSNHSEMLQNGFFPRKKNIEISTFLFKLKPTAASFFILVTAYLNTPSVYPVLKSSINQLLLFIKNRIRKVALI